MKKTVLLLFLLVFAFNTAAHEPVDYLPIDPFPMAIQAFSIILLLSIISVGFQERLTSFHKKAIFVIVSLLVIGVTLYAGATTVYLNLISESGGPVHWHADFEILLCDQKISSVEGAHAPPGFSLLTMRRSHDLSNRVGSPTLHYHNDDRIHVEGVVIQKKDVSLGEFFEVIGGKMTHDSISVPLDDKTIITKKNGDLCNGKPGVLKLFVKNENQPEFVRNKELENYVLSPHFETVLTGGKGDILRIVFEPEEP